MFDHTRTLEVLQSLPEALESLILRFPDSPSIFAGGLQPLSVKSTFPDLKTLILEDSANLGPTSALPRQLIPTTASFLTDLPQSITDLHIRLPTDSDADSIRHVMQALPPSLVRLSIISLDDVLLTASFLFPLLPSRLVHLRLLIETAGNNLLGALDRFDASNLAFLPRSLASVSYHSRHLATHFLPIGLSSLNLDSFPSEEFVLLWTRACGSFVPPFISSANVTFRFEDKLISDMETLPVHLGALYILNATPFEPKHINILPPRLTTLRVGRINLSKGMRFPTTLRRFGAMINGSIDKKAARSLPPLVEMNLLGKIAYDNVSLLPRTLTWLRISVTDLKAEVSWPPRLGTLFLSGTSLTLFGHAKKGKIVPLDIPPATFPLTASRQPPNSIIMHTLRMLSLPSTLTKLHLHFFGVPVSELLSLPPFLKYLHIDYILDGEVPNATSEATLRKARDLLRNDEESGKYDFCLLGRPQVTVCDLFPRSLTYLGYHGFADFPPIVWSRLPRKLVTLHLQTVEPIHEDSLLYIPKSCLKRFSAKVSGPLRDEHLTSMPTNLKLFDLLCSEPPQLSALAADASPVRTSLKGPDVGISPFTIALRQRLKLLSDAAQNDDINELKRLNGAPSGDS